MILHVSTTTPNQYRNNPVRNQYSLTLMSSECALCSQFLHSQEMADLKIKGGARALGAPRARKIEKARGSAWGIVKTRKQPIGTRRKQNRKAQKCKRGGWTRLFLVDLGGWDEGLRR